jgi:nucleotide-binding universal stress UspA family protein/nitrite reductase/ring-hydroxylating ferredoxin subunit
MAYETIVVGTDGSETARVAGRVAVDLARASGAGIIAVSAYHDEAGKHRAVAAVDAARAKAETSGVEARIELAHARPAKAITEIADRLDAGLVVVGDVGMGGPRRFRLGGIADEVSHTMPCDLLIVRTSRPERAARPGQYRSVLIAPDGSGTADHAARVGEEFARLMGATISLVSVGDQAMARIVLRDAAERLGHPHVPMHVLSRDLGDRIVEVAGSEGQDLVVVGNKGMAGALRFVMGAVPNTVSHNAPCDVLMVNTVGRSLADLEPGEGVIVLVDGRKVAAFRGQNGSMVTLSPKCKHLGCTVGWNHRARTWDCPCHGSRYESDGRVRNGPTPHPLDPLEVTPDS